MDASYGNYVDDEYFDNHEYDDDTADDTGDDTDDDIDDDTDDVVGPWSMSNSGGQRVHSVRDSSPQWRMGWDGLGWGGMGWVGGALVRFTLKHNNPNLKGGELAKQQGR